MLYFGRRHVGSAAAQELRQFRCGACGGAWPALVAGLGVGAGDSPFALKEAYAKANARRRARQAARENLELTLSLAKCPGCGAVNRRAWWAARAATLPCFALIATGGSLATFWALRSMSSVIVAICFDVPLAVLAVVVWNSERWKWQTVSQRVFFPNEEQLRELEADTE